MNGRFLTIKKSTWLMISFIANMLAFVSLSVFFIFATKDYNAVFFLFCICVGIHHLIRGGLFSFDSSFYLGVLLLLVGGLYFFAQALNIIWVYPVFIIFSFAFASFSVGYFYKEPFQVFLSLSLYFVGIGLLLFLLKIISVWIFVAIIIISVLLLAVRFFRL